jgi:uncharacterized coiled-coil DUF342 family protein
MKKTVLLTLAIGFATSTMVFAQSAQAPANTPATNARRAPISNVDKAKQATDKIANQAKLTMDQSNSVYNVLLNYYTKVEPIKKADTGKNSPEAKAKIDALKNDVYTKLQGILSTDQLATVKAMFGAQGK